MKLMFAVVSTQTMTSNLRILVTCWLVSTLISQAEAQNLHFGLGSARFANFVKHPFHYLNTAKATSLIYVSDFAKCAFQCMQTLTCVSVNMAATETLGESGLLWCELLASDIYNDPNNFQDNGTSHHFSIATPCRYYSCGNGGKCQPSYNDNSYKCQCLVGFAGENCHDCDTANGWKKFNHACYKLFSNRKPWDGAKQQCEEMNSILATIFSPGENEFVSSLVSTLDPAYAWIGASDTASEGTWVWVDGSGLDGYTNWGGKNPDGKPNEDCVLISDGLWNDVPCSLGRPYICKLNVDN